MRFPVGNFESKSQLIDFFQNTSFDTPAQNLLHRFIIQLLDKKDQSDVVKGVEDILSTYGIHFDAPDNYNRAPLFYSVVIGNLSLVSFFLKKGALVNRKTNFHKISPLCKAVEACNVDIVELLLKHGADPNTSNALGVTPLHVACWKNNELIIKLLIQNGADVCAKHCYTNLPFLPSPTRTLDNYRRCSIIMIKEFARRHFENLIKCEDINLILKNANLSTSGREEFEECMDELNQMENTVFYSPYSYYSVIKMSKKIKKLPPLTSNGEYCNKFQENLHRFPYYEEN